MLLDNQDLLKLTQIAIKAALRAGEIIAKEQGNPIMVNSKEGGENLASCVVTKIDLMAQEAILDVLSPSLKEYDLGLLTEESVDDNSRFEKDFFWCIDPLDGTLCFSRNEDGYSTSIALISKSGTPIIGVVFNPRSNCLYHAIKDNGAFKNDLPLIVKDKSLYLTLLYDQSFLKHPNYAKEIENLKTKAIKLGLKEVKLYPLGGAVMNGISTIEFAPAIYYKHPKAALGGGSLWDFAASSVIQSEAGGYNSDYDNNPLDLNRADSTFMNHRGVVYCSSKQLLLE
ncbi:MAG: inositol monophosphatase [Halobacteriovoraceae bacterium]|jgi:fructose-1,6-bisphosphatase/inositol monophosphatase family enzyme|nr:inositol monophosphatase [Halobacteriovoraceae bacterium]